MHPALGRELWETSVRNLRWEPGSCQRQRAPTAFGASLTLELLGLMERSCWAGLVLEQPAAMLTVISVIFAALHSDLGRFSVGSPDFRL